MKLRKKNIVGMVDIADLKKKDTHISRRQEFKIVNIMLDQQVLAEIILETTLTLSKNKTHK